MSCTRQPNTLSESQFKTMKYRPNFPDRFGCIEDGRRFCGHFFLWYNDEHRHSGLGLHTPASVHYGRAAGIREHRVDVLAGAYAAHPERFVRVIPQPPAASNRCLDQPASAGGAESSVRCNTLLLRKRMQDFWDRHG